MRNLTRNRSKNLNMVKYHKGEIKAAVPSAVGIIYFKISRVEAVFQMDRPGADDLFELSVEDTILYINPKNKIPTKYL